MAKKTSDRRRRHEGQAKPPATTQVLQVERPEPPPDLEPVIQDAWDMFWESPLAEHIRQTDLMEIRRLFMLYDEVEKTRTVIVSDPPPQPVRGVHETHNDYMMRQREWRIEAESRGRLVRSAATLKLNPLLSYIIQLEGKIVPLEDRFGLNLKARQELGLNVLKAKTLAEHNAATSREEDQEEIDEDDPRLKLVEGDT